MNVPIDIVAPDELVQVLRFVGRIIPWVLYQRTLFVGSPCSDEGTIGFSPGIDRGEALLTLQTALEKKAREFRTQMIVWKDFPESSCADLDWLSREKGLFRLVSFPSTLVEFSSRRKEDYFASIKASRRQKLKRKLRRSASKSDVTVEVVQHPSTRVLDDIFGLFWQTYSKAATKFERLNRAWFENIAAQEVAHFIVLRDRASGEMVAFMLCFDAGERLINKFIGIDYGKPKEWLLYFLLWDAAVDWALARGFSSIQSGQTTYAAKIEMGHRLVPLTNYCRHRNPLIHALYRAVAKTVNWSSLDGELTLFLKAHPEADGCSPKSKAKKDAKLVASEPKAAA
jgi:hypothetical protein